MRIVTPPGSSHLNNSEEGLSSGQLSLDVLTAQFSEMASDRSSLLAMTAGGLTSRLARVGFLSLLSPLPSFVRTPLVSALSLTIEVGTFRGINHLFAPSSESYWNTQGWAREAINFACLKSLGHYLRSKNVLLRHVTQNFAMMAGEEAGSRLHLTPEVHGSFAERFVRASVMNLSLEAGAALSRRLLGGKGSVLERSLEQRSRILESHEAFKNSISSSMEWANLPRMNSPRAKLENPKKTPSLGQISKDFQRQTNKRLGLIDIVILTDLSLYGPTYGKDLIKRIKRRTGLVLHMGTVYPLLNLLEVQKILSSETRDISHVKGGRPEIHYSLTEAGKSLTENLLSALKGTFERETTSS